MPIFQLVIARKNMSFSSPEISYLQDSSPARVSRLIFAYFGRTENWQLGELKVSSGDIKHTYYVHKGIFFPRENYL